MEKGIPKARIAGAVAAALGTYLAVRVFQKTGGDILREIGFALGIFAPRFDPTAPEGERFEGGIGGIGEEGEVLLAPEPFAIALGLITGGMVLAGQNPGEILKGIGEIIPG